MKTSTQTRTRLRIGFALFSVILVIYCAMLGGNVYQLFAEIPNWSADPVNALVAYRQFFRHSHAGYFFQIFAPLTILGLIASAVLLWNHSKALNRWLLTALLGTVAVEVFTLLYFLPRNFVLFLNPLEEVSAQTLLTMASQWQKANYVRLAIVLANVIPFLKVYRILCSQQNQMPFSSQTEAFSGADSSVPGRTKSANRFTYFLGLFLALSLGSCKHNSDIIPVDEAGDLPANPQKPAEAVTPVAQPEGTIMTATVGPAGGSLVSADKRLRVDIPAGALSSSQTISMQALNKNHCPLGTGQAFRLLPHGLIFAKPAILTFQYNEKDINGSAPQVLRIAYQTDQGYWKSPITTGLDTTAKTLSVQTTHFSDWGLFQSMRLRPDQSFLNPGEQQELSVVMIPFSDDKSDDLVVPLLGLMPAKHVEKWTLSGAGTLSHQHNVGKYYAPEKIPTINPATVTVFLNKSVTIGGQLFKDIRLVANIYVAPEGISFQVGKEGWRTFPGGANLNSPQNVVAGAVGNEHVQVIWTGAASGSFHWTEGPGISFLYVNGPFFRSHMYFKVVSGGELRVDASNAEWVVGTLTLTSAGWIDSSSAPPAHGTTSITGVFRVRRV